MARFCSRCGSALIPETGLCPRCVSDEPTIRVDKPAQKDIDATVRVSPVPTAAPVAPVAPAQEDIDATVRVSPVPTAAPVAPAAPVQEDIDATVRVSPVPTAAPVAPAAPAQEDIDATVRVNPVPAGAPAAPQNPVGNDAEATVRVNPAPVQDYDATTRVNRAPAAPQRPASPPPATGYTQVFSNPVYAEPAPAPKKKKSAGTVVATVFLAISLFIFLLASTLLLSVRIFTSEKILKDTFSKVEFSDVMDAANDFIDTDEKDEDFVSVFYNNLSVKIKDVTGEKVDRRRMEKAINKSSIMDFLADKAVVFFSDVMNNEKEFELDEPDVKEFLDDNFDVIEDVFDVNITRDMKHKITKATADVIVPDEIEDFYPSQMKKQNPTVFNIVSICFNWAVIIGLFALVALVIFLMIKNDLSQAAVGGGIVCLIVGGLFTLGGLLALIGPGIWESILGNVLFGTFACSYMTANLPVFGSVFAIGLIGLVVRSIILKSQSKRR